MEGIVIGSSGRILARSDVLAKARSHKYVKRTGSSGAYKYWYRNAKGELFAGRKPKEERGAGLSFDERVLREEADDAEHGDRTVAERKGIKVGSKVKTNYGDTGEVIAIRNNVLTIYDGKSGKEIHADKAWPVEGGKGAKAKYNGVDFESGGKVVDVATEKRKDSELWRQIKPEFEKLSPGHRDRLMARSKTRPWTDQFKQGDQVEYEWKGKKESGKLVKIDEPTEQMSGATVRDPDGTEYRVQMPMIAKKGK